MLKQEFCAQRAHCFSGFPSVEEWGMRRLRAETRNQIVKKVLGSSILQWLGTSSPNPSVLILNTLKGFLKLIFFHFQAVLLSSTSTNIHSNFLHHPVFSSIKPVIRIFLLIKLVKSQQLEYKFLITKESRKNKKRIIQEFREDICDLYDQRISNQEKRAKN